MTPEQRTARRVALQYAIRLMLDDKMEAEKLEHATGMVKFTNECLAVLGEMLQGEELRR